MKTIALESDKRPTMQKIAEVAGVSASTVSLALSDDSRVRKETRDRIFAIALEMGYITEDELENNRRRREVRKQKARYAFVCIGKNNDEIMSSDFTNRLMHNPVERQSRIEVMAISSSDGKDVLEQLLSIAPDTDGFLLNGRIEWQLLSGLRKTQLPVVVVGPIIGPTPRDDEGFRVVAVGHDEIAASSEATAYLISQGHRRIGLVTARGIPGLYYDRILDGYRLALSRAGLDYDEELVDYSEVMLPAESAEVPFDGLEDPPSAFLVPNVNIALRFRFAMLRAGRSLPPECTVVFMDEEEAANEGLDVFPRIDFSNEKLVERCVESLHHLRERKGPVIEHVILPHHLVV